MSSLATVDYSAWTLEELETELARLEGELATVDARIVEVRDQYYRVSEQARTLTVQLEGTEFQLVAARADLANSTRRWIPQRLTLGREKARLIRRIAYARIVERVVIGERVREINEELARLRLENIGFRSVVEELGGEARRLRAQIAALPDLATLLREVERLEAEGNRLRDEIERVKEEIEKRVGYIEREYTAYLEYPEALARPGSPPVRFEARGVFTIPRRIPPDSDIVRVVIQDKLFSAIEEVGKTRTRVDPETREVITETFEPSVIDRDDFPIQGLIVGTEDLGETDTFNESVPVDVVKMVKMREIQRWRVTVDITEDEITG